VQISVGAQIHQTCYATGSLAGTWPRVRLGWTTSGPPPGSGSESSGWTASGPPPGPPRGGALPRPARPPPPDGTDPARAAASANTAAAAANPPTAQDGRAARLRRSRRRSARDAPFSPRRPRTRPPAEAAAPGPRRHPHTPPPCAAPQPADPPARFAPPAWEKPRQRTTDRRRQTAARIDDNPNSPNSGPQPPPAAEATAGLVAVAMTKAVLPGDAGLHRQSTPSGCPCGRRGQPQVTGSERFDDRTIAPKTISPPSGRSRAAALNSEICSLTLASTCHA